MGLCLLGLEYKVCERRPPKEDVTFFVIIIGFHLGGVENATQRKGGIELHIDR